MTPARLLLDLLDSDLQLWGEGDSVGFRGPKGALTPALKQRLLANKPALVELLGNGRKHARLSYPQLRLWFLDQLDPDSPTYNMPDAIRLRGALQPAALAAAFTEIARRHEVLRSSFPSVEDQPLQITAPPTPIVLPEVDLTALTAEHRPVEAQRLVDAELLRPFDLAVGPLWRSTLLRLDRREHVLLLNLHHAISDGWSQGVLFRELAALYRAAASHLPSPLPALTAQYVDFAIWQHRRLTGKRLQAELDFWTRQLANAQAQELPTDRPRPPRPRHRGAVAPVTFDAETTAGLRQLSIDADGSLFMTLSAGLTSLLQRLSGRDDIIVGTPIANRRRQEFESLIGFFVNSLVLRHKVPVDLRFGQLLEQARETALQAYSHQDLPFERLVEELQPRRDLSRNPIFQVSLALLNAPREKIQLPDLSLTPWGFRRHVVRLDLEIFLWEVEHQDGETILEGEIYYDLDLWDASTISRWTRHLGTLLRAVQDPEREVRRLSIFEPSQRQQLLVEWSEQQASDEVEVECLHGLFRSQADRRPETVALATDDHQISYRQLARQVTGLAAELRRLGAGPETRVAVLVDRSPGMVVTLLAILEAGAAYVPLDPSYPSERLTRILENCGASILVTEEATPDMPFAGTVLRFASQPTTYSDGSPGANPNVTSDNLAYVIYTSGSTGLPKGVQITHRALDNFLHSMAREPGFTSRDILLAATTISFDIAGLELFLPLVSGARLHLADAVTAADPFRLARMLEESRATVVQATPSGWRNLLSTVDRPQDSDRSDSDLNLSDLKVLCGGEGLPSDLVTELQAHGGDVWNLYGPTETTVWSTLSRLPSSDRSQSTARPLATIGRAIDGTSTYLLDRHLEPVTIGAAGELFIGGRGLSRGYLGQPRWTAESFVPNLLGSRPGTRLYRTGDLAEQAADGQLHFLQRIDHQVKVRGFRIELGEIEAVLEQLPSVHQAVALAADRPGGERNDPQLVVYATRDARFRESTAVEAGWRRDRVAQWRGVWDQIYGTTPSTDATSDTTGWVSSYTGEALPEGEMREWIDHTVQRISELTPHHILEIGCGTGLLLHRLAQGVDSYLATDISAIVISRLERQLARPELATVELRRQAADDFMGVDGGVFDTVILNSVVQYFPSIDYLSTVLSKAVERAAVGASIFIGDVRSLPLIELFCTSVELASASPELPPKELAQRAQQRRWREEELLIDPAFFVALQDQLARVSAVRIRPKAGHHDNEMIRFRYDVVLHLDADVDDTCVDDGEVKDSDVDKLDWRSRPDLDALRETLRSQRPAALILRHIPNRRLANDLRLRSLLSKTDAFDSIAELRNAVRVDDTAGLPSTHDARRPEDFETLCRDLPYACEASWAQTDDAGSYDILFWLGEPGTCPPADLLAASHNGFASQPSSLDNRPSLDNNPLVDKSLQRLKSRWREHLAERLPAYMVPTVIVPLRSLPMTLNGKIDRAALVRQAQQQGSRESYVAPRTTSEIALAEIWSEVLALERVGIDHDFFGLGGHSLLATQVISRVRHRFAVEMALRTLFEGPSLRQMARALDSLLRHRGISAQHSVGGEHAGGTEHLGGAERPHRDTIAPQPRNCPLPLSFAQRRLWFLQQLDPDNAAYNMPAAYRLDGSLQPAELESALTSIAARHEVLRTRFPEIEGHPVQVVSEPSRVWLPIVDLSALLQNHRRRTARDLTDQEARRPFDLSTGPLTRALLLRSEHRHHILVLNHHHITTDGWSMGLFHRELAHHYRAVRRRQAASLPPLPIQYADFAHWQQRWLQGERLAGQLDYWRRQLAGPTALALPTDRPHPAHRSYRGAARQMALSTTRSDALRSLSRNAGASLFMTLLAVFNTLLHRLTGQLDILVGSPIANRNREDIEGLIGFFVNTLVLRSDLTGQPSFHKVLQRAREVALNAYAHQDLPFERLIEELQPDRDLSRNPLVQVSFALQNAPHSNIDLEGVELSSYDLAARFARFDLEVHLWETSAGLRGTWLYGTELWDDTTVERITRHFLRLLDEVTLSPDISIAELPLLSASEQHQLRVEWGQPQVANLEDGGFRPVTRQIRDHIESCPDGVALTCGDDAVTYGRLGQLAQNLASELRRRGAGAETTIGLLVERSPGMMWGLLAILESGAAYLPLDPTLPPQRLAEILTSSGAAFVVTEVSAIAEVSVPKTCQVIDLDNPFDSPASQVSEGSQLAEPNADQLAYVIYTSGSTGRPKGVQITHRALSNFLHSLAIEPGLVANDILLAVTTVGFDIAALELFLPLVRGARVAIASASDSVDAFELRRLLDTSRANVMQATPATWSNLLAAGWPGDRHLRMWCGGEALTHDLASRLQRRGGELWNLYGPTETTIWSTVQRVALPAAPNVGDGSVPLGWPIAATRVVILGPGLASVPIGGIGELHIAGKGLTRGYLAQPALTAEKHRPDPTRQYPGERLYRTGDQVRRLSNGALRYLGRLDHQVKLRGFRIELGEIEAVLATHPQVNEAAAVCLESPDHAGRLFAFVTPERTVETLPARRAEWQHAQLEQWQTVWDDVYSQPENRPDSTFDTSGWISSTTHKPIAAPEMRQWLEAIIERIAVLAPRRVLEIGCGTGMVLFRVAPQCDRYTATDISPTVLKNLQQGLTRAPSEMPQVHLLRRPADDFEGFADDCFDTAILSSVVQYFPSVDYLLQVLRSAIRCTAPGGAIFIGDVRNLILHNAFCASVEAHRAEPSMPMDVLRRRWQRRRDDEEELLLAPAFFEALRDTEPAIRSLEILPKHGRQRNELNLFRFDAILHLEPVDDLNGTRNHGAEAIPDNGLATLDWHVDAVTPDLLRQKLSSRPSRWLVKNLPDPRVAAALVLAKDLLQVSDLQSASRPDKTLRDRSEPGIEPADILALGHQLGYRTEVRLSGMSAPGCFEAWFTPSSAPAWISDVRRPASPPEPWSALANDPLRGRATRRLLSQLRKYLAERLPEYMIPNGFAVRKTLPLTPNRKIDRVTLARYAKLAGADGGSTATTFVAPGGQWQEAVAKIWRDLLVIDRLGADDNFFEMGGHSLLATQVVSRIRRTLGRDLPVRAIFEAPTVRSLAEVLASMSATASTRDATSGPPLLRGQRAANEPIPLSSAQQRLWFLAQLEPTSSAYNLPMALSLRGDLDVGALNGCLAGILRRHEILRTGFPHHDGLPHQAITGVPKLCLPVVDLSALRHRSWHSETQKLTGAAAMAPFDLTRAPLLRSLLLCRSSSEHVLMLTLHHIVSDAWSQRVLRRELIALYRALTAGRPSPLPPLPIQYADFAIWQRRWLGDRTLEHQLIYWCRQLHSLPVVKLPRDRPARRLPTGFQAPRGGTASRLLRPPLAIAITRLGVEARASLFMTFLATFGAWLGRAIGGDDVVVGSPIANRNHQEIESLIGFFVNTLVLRIDLSGDLSFSDLLTRARETCLEGYAHQDLPFDKLVEALQPQRDLQHNPLFQILFNMLEEDKDTPADDKSPLAITRFPIGGQPETKLDISLHAIERADGIALHLVFDRDLFDTVRMFRLLESLEILLTGAVSDPHRRLHDLPSLSAGQLHQLLVEWPGQTAATPPTEGSATSSASSVKTLPQQFWAQAAETPDAVALTFESRTISYGSLAHLAERWARQIADHQAGPDVVVGILFRRSPELVTAVLAVLQAGAAYLPLDPLYPAERLSYQLTDGGARLLVVEPALADLASQLSSQVLVLEASRRNQEYPLPNHPRRSPEQPPNSLSGTNLAYLAYTSGSTGRPKGVLATHAAAVVYLRFLCQAYDLGPDDTSLQTASASFDSSLRDMLAPLTVGARVVLIPEDAAKDPDALVSAAAKVRASCLLSVVPTLTEHLLTAFQRTAVPISYLRLLLLAGESFTHSLGRRIHRHFGSGLQVINQYGPTEGTCTTTSYPIPPASFPVAPTTAGSHSLGRPNPGTAIYLLRPNLSPVDLGYPGEIYIGGVRLARGYANRPRRTAVSFLPDRLGSNAGSRLYRTGDLARYRHDGLLEFLGRIDRQLKIRGVRVEPGGIETVLKGHPAVKEVAVIARQFDPSDTRLIAFLTLESHHRSLGIKISAELRNWLATRLPTPLIPGLFIPLDNIPVTANGKLDRSALDRIEVTASPDSTEDDIEGPRSADERILLEIWREVLGAPVRLTDNFFEAGGHSLLAVRLLALIERRLGIRLPLSSLFHGATIVDQAQAIYLPRQQTGLVEIEPGNPTTSRLHQPFFCIHPVGGNVLCYADLSRHLGAAQPFYGLEARGLDGEHLHHDLQAMASDYLAVIRTRQPNGPYSLGGWSMGGLIAFEIAKKLQAQEQEVALLALIDTRVHSQAPEPRVGDKGRRLQAFAAGLGLTTNGGGQQGGPVDSDSDQALSQILERAKDARLVSTETDLPRIWHLFRVFENNLQLMQRYTPEHYTGAIHLFRAQESHLQNAGDPTLGWGQVAAGQLDVTFVPGNHLTIVREPNVQALAEALNATLRRS